MEAQNQMLVQLLQQGKNKETTEEQLPSLDEIDESFFQSDEFTIDPNFSRKLVEGMKKIVQTAIDREKQTYNTTAKAQREKMAKQQAEQLRLAEKADAEFGGDEFGQILKRGANGQAIAYDMDSPLVKKADQILRTDPDINKFPADIREYVAFAQAKAALVASKKSKPAAPSGKGFEAQGGREAAATGVGGAFVDGKGRFTRILSDEEFDKLTAAEKDSYMRQSVDLRQAAR